MEGTNVCKECGYEFVTYNVDYDEICEECSEEVIEKGLKARHDELVEQHIRTTERG